MSERSVTFPMLASCSEPCQEKMREGLPDIVAIQSRGAAFPACRFLLLALGRPERLPRSSHENCFPLITDCFPGHFTFVLTELATRRQNHA